MSRSRPCFAGEIGLIGLFDLGQLLMLNRATGTLVVRCDSGKGTFFFEEGRLVHAVDDRMREGEEAAYRLFAWKTGTFDFRPQPAQGEATIHHGTDAIMMEAARRLDEAAELGVQETDGHEVRLRERQGTLEALRDVFQRVTGEARPQAPGGEGPGLDLRTLTRAGDRLLYRSGHPPCLEREGAWSEGGTTLLAGDYQELRAGLFEASTPLPGSPGRRRLALTGGRTFLLEIVGSGAEELLWLRPIELPPPDPGLLDGDLECIEEIAAAGRGLTLVGGEDPDRARELLQALLPRLLEDGESLLMVSDDHTYRHDHAHRLIRIGPVAARGALRALTPRTVILDPACGPGVLGLEDLALVPRVVAGCVGADPATLACGWIARLADPAGRAATVLGGQPITILAAHGALHEEAIGFSAWRLTEVERSLALRGETVALAEALIRTGAADFPTLIG
jgi:uncharacterized protein DUF4388